MHRILSRRLQSLRRAALCGLLGAVLTGCSEETRSELTEQLKQSADAVAQKAEQVSEAASEQAVAATERATAIVDATEMQFQLDAPEPIVTDGCFSEWLTFSDGRPSVLQLRSYSESERETFPAVFLRAIVPGTTAVPYGQTVPAKLFVQATAGGPIFYTPDDQLVELSIGEQGQTTAATVVGGSLFRSDNGAAIPATGRVVFALR